MYAHKSVSFICWWLDYLLQTTPELHYFYHDQFTCAQCATDLAKNHDKSHILIGGLSEFDSHLITQLSELQYMPRNSVYLGIPLSITKLSAIRCLPLFDSITNKFNRWPTQLLSQASRLTIISSIVVAMVSYIPRTFILPKKLISILNMAFNHFLWHGDWFSKNPSLYGFHKINKPKYAGGQGILNLTLWNKAATSKHLNNLLLPDHTM